MTLRNHLINLLVEGKIDDVMSKYDSIPEHIKQHYLNQIPDKNSNHLQWVLDNHLKNTVDIHNNVKSVLDTFNKSKDKLPKKQIHQYKNFNELENAVEPYKHITTNKDKINNDTITDYENNHIKVTQHLSNESMVQGAKLSKKNQYHDILNGKAKWCTAADSENGKMLFKQYTDDGESPHYIIHNKDTGRKTAVVFNSNELELRDETDRDLNRNDGIHKLFIDNDGLEHSAVGKKFIDEYDVKPQLDEVNKHTKIPEIDEFEKLPIKKKGLWLHRDDLPNNYIKSALKSVSSTIREQAVLHKNADNNDINQAMTDDNYMVRGAAIENPKSTYENLDKAIVDKADYVTEASLSHKDMNEDRLTKILKNRNQDWLIKAKTLQHPKINTNHLEIAMNGLPKLREAVMNHPLVTSKMLDDGLNDDSPHVAIAAINSPNATSHHVKLALESPTRLVRLDAIKNKHATPENINKALDDESTEIKEWAMSHPNVNSDNIEKASTDKNQYIRMLAAFHDKTTKEQLTKLSKDEEPAVYITAKNRLTKM